VIENNNRWGLQVELPDKLGTGILEVYKLTGWTQGPAMLEALNILENFDLKAKAMAYNNARYIHALYQGMSLAFADRDFY
jgi:gamma-glutamyltranspeptidase/glutathione hydrolase